MEGEHLTSKVKNAFKSAINTTLQNAFFFFLRSENKFLFFFKQEKDLLAFPFDKAAGMCVMKRGKYN